jgi:hypothetical protein
MAKNRDNPIVKFELDPQEKWYVTLFDPQGANVYGPFDTEQEAQRWLNDNGGNGHVWKRIGFD